MKCPNCKREALNKYRSGDGGRGDYIVYMHPKAKCLVRAPKRQHPELDNRTRWRDDDLRRFLRAGLDHMGASRRKVIVLHDQDGRNLGRGSYPHYDSEREGAWIELKLPKVVARYGKRDVFEARDGTIHYNAWKHLASDGPMRRSVMRSIAGTVVHEIMHNQGLRHKDMAPGHHEDIEWTEGLVIRPKAGAVPKAVKATRQCNRCEQVVRKKLVRCPICKRLVCTRCAAWRQATFRLCKDCAA